MQVLEPKDGNELRTWEQRSSGIGELMLMEDDDQPLPTNVMYPGTSDLFDPTLMDLPPKDEQDL
jgi:hypothetical protein